LRSNFTVGSPFKPPLTKDLSTHNHIEIPPPQVKALDKRKGIASEPPKRLGGKKYFKFYGFVHFQVDCLNAIIKVKDIQAH